MKRRILFFISFLLLFGIISASAHPGKTDARGGHYNQSTGEYHFHHGYPAHQHTNGVCPYDYDDKTGVNSGSPSSGASSTVSTASQTKSYDEGYETGYADGEAAGKKAAEEQAAETNEEYRAIGYEQGFADGKSEGISEGNPSDKKTIESLESNLNRKQVLLYAGLIGIIISACTACGLWEKNGRLSRTVISQNESIKGHIAQVSFLRQEIEKKDRQLASYQKSIRQERERRLKLESQLPRSTHAKPEPLDGLLKKNAQLLTFGHWPPNVHHSEKQLKKYRKAKSEGMKIYKVSDSQVRVFGVSGISYLVSLDSCECKDFVLNERRQAPCKHIYFAALRLGLPLSDIFGE